VVAPIIERMIDTLPDLDTAALLAAASGAVRERRLAEVRDLAVLAQWAAVHSKDPTEGPEGRRARRLGDVLVHPGGEGTPGVQDFCLGEIALARGTGVTATSNAMADVLDLQHRLPRTWAVLRAGEAEVYIARRVAKLSRHLPADRVGVVDAAVARIIAHEAGGRVLAVAEAKIIEADPALHDERAEAERARRYVGLGRTDEFGLRTVVARIVAGDAVWVDATVQRVAEILAPAHPHSSADELRAIAFGFLARPAELLQLLLDHNEPGADEPPDTSRATAFPADLLEALRAADLSPLAPRAVLLCPPSRGRAQQCRRGRPRGGSRPGADLGTVQPPPKDEADRSPGARPVLTRPIDRLRAPRVAQGADLPEDRRRLLALRHLDQPAGRLRPPHGVRRHRPAGSDRLPQLRPSGSTTSPLEDPRGLPVAPVR
jgi:hypothetical protein